ncbi:ribonuclease H [Senna tora]|uniref:Ribonuclease H n=1 Tax=Senna tora TaxID=362788 RepID=A0A834WPI2_9FABA|nr:ribonuclease H [Senna tora]
MIKNRNGDWTESKEEVKSIIVDFYKELFKEDQPIRDVESFTPCWPHVDQSTWDRLSSPFLEEEVKRAVFNIGGTKAPGSDGFPASFYHQNWSTISGRDLKLLGGVLELKSLMEDKRGRILDISLIKFRRVWLARKQTLSPWLGEMNKAFIFKVAWQLINNKDTLWVKILKNKYRCNTKPGAMVKAKDSDSRLWREISKVWQDFYQNVAWEVGQWNYDMLSSLLPNDVIYKINVNPPNESHGPDLPIWCPEANGKFSTCSAYYSTKGLRLKKSPTSWDVIWKSWVKVNTDGAVGSTGNIAGCGGLIRDHQGNLIKGFIKNLGISSPEGAEAWGIVCGLNLAWDLGFQKVVLENDCLRIIKQINNVNNLAQQMHSTIPAIRSMISRDWDVKLVHCYKNVNACADILAKFSLNNSGGLNMLDAPPVCIASLVQRDAAGLNAPRDPGG